MFLKYIIHRIVLYNIGLQLLLSIPIGHTETINASVVNNANEIVNFSEADVLSSRGNDRQGKISAGRIRNADH